MASVKNIERELQLLEDGGSVEGLLIDPFEYITEPDIHNLIFQHLSPSDVKNLFLVSHARNKAASTSKQAMLKLDLVTETKRKIIKQKFASILKSRRHYQRAIIKFDCFGQLKQKAGLIEKFAHSLEELELRTTKRHLPVPSDLCFPQLRKMKMFIQEISFVDFHRILSSTTDRLKQLELNCAQDLFNYPMPSFGAKLTSLSLLFVCQPFELQQPLKDILLEMSPTLKFMRINDCTLNTLEFLFKEMKVLSVLQTDMGVKFENNNLKAIRNQSIDTLIWEHGCGFTFFLSISSTARSLLQSMENLQTIEIPSCDEIRLRNILTVCQHIKRIKIVFWRDFEHPSDYYRMLTEKYPSVPKDIEIDHSCSDDRCCYDPERLSDYFDDDDDIWDDDYEYDYDIVWW